MRARSSRKRRVRLQAVLKPPVRNLASIRGVREHGRKTIKWRKSCCDASREESRQTNHSWNEVMEAVVQKSSGKTSLASDSAGELLSSDRSAATAVHSPVGAPSQTATSNPTPASKAADAEDSSTSKTAKAGGSKHGFKTGEFIVYPSHGVGQIVSIEDKEVAGFRLELFVISFSKDKMTLRFRFRKLRPSACANCRTMTP